MKTKEVKVSKFIENFEDEPEEVKVLAVYLMELYKKEEVSPGILLRARQAGRRLRDAGVFHCISCDRSYCKEDGTDRDV